MKQTDVVTLEMTTGEEIDYVVRANVEIEPSRSRGVEAWIDGSLEVETAPGQWTDIADMAVTSESRIRASDSLMDLALEDDSDECVDDDYAYEVAS